ncbi:hypothetical protein FOZ60_003733 [Perkinsus olseni]|uniref:Uncharacterized protein n=1 Tax=Perkinsus olseni TaxID=32597 RepID=A0A7J6PJS7_PEROL|nr:hypothetical protein FOZ60_003733 [Perkinsus olseni]
MEASSRNGTSDGDRGYRSRCFTEHIEGLAKLRQLTGDDEEELRERNGRIACILFEIQAHLILGKGPIETISDHRVGADSNCDKSPSPKLWRAVGYLVEPFFRLPTYELTLKLGYVLPEDERRSFIMTLDIARVLIEVRTLRLS